MNTMPREEDMGRWERVMWEDLDAMSDAEAFISAGEIISLMTHDILPALARYRRQRAVSAVEKPDMDATKFAETVGSTLSAINRLVEQGRAQLRREEAKVTTGGI